MSTEACMTADPGVAANRVVDLPGGQLTVTARPGPWSLDALCGFAARNNPKRAFLFVSRVLGRHVPVAPAVMRATYRALAAAIPTDLPGPVAVVGMAETAVALSTGVFAEWRAVTGRDDAVFVHSTRYALPQPRAAEFREDHSHAADHIVYRPTAALAADRLHSARSLVLIDDEMTSGRTFANLRTGLAVACPAVERAVGVVLTDWGGAAGAQVAGMPVVSLLAGSYRLDPDPNYVPGTPPKVVGDGAEKPFLVRNDGRLGITAPPDLGDVGRAAVCALPICPGQTALVLGTGEFVYPPFLVGEALAARGVPVRCQATTRSPVLPGHAITHVRIFTDNYGDGIANFLYNVPPGTYDHVVVCTETPDPPVGLIRQFDAEGQAVTVLPMGLMAEARP